jgi:DDE superfamily endonuclease
LACMEDVLRLYGQSAREGVGRICVDERPCQLVGDVIAPLPLKAGQSKRIDNEYERKGTCTVFLAYDIDNGQRYAEVREHHTKKDYALFVDKVIGQHYAGVGKVMVVQDNLNTHRKGSFYEHLPVQRAGELSELLEFHYTPKHGSWLNMVEIEFSALVRQCLDRRIDSIAVLDKELQAWVAQRNEECITIHWSFTVNDARQKLNTHYQKVYAARPQPQSSA